jgi:dipeptidyl-peptidase-4
LFFLLLFLPALLLSQAQTFPTLDDALRSGSQLSGSNGPRNINWIDGGNRFSYLATNTQARRSEIRSFNPADQSDELLFDGQGLLFPGTDMPFSYDSFQWAGDAKHLLFQANFRPIYRHSGISDYYFYSLTDKTLQQVAQDAGTAELSPDGSRIGFERDGDMYIYDFATSKEVRLTRDAREHVFNGRFGWVYEEEFTLAQAWSWSNDSRYIAFWQEDESQVPIFQMTDYAD